MTLRVYDTLTRREREFEPVRPGHVGMYVCGMTVQDKPHIGHFVPFLTGDIIRRYLEHKGFQVTHVQNFTDIDDKIIARAEAEGITARQVAERNIERFHAAAAAMNVLPATHYPKATEHIPEIVALIETLIDKEFAYPAANGDVYFRVRRLSSYGKLSGRNIDDLMSGARIEIGEQKDDPLDFALWKAAKPGEPAWSSPWGQGRPGWHIECSAMAMKYLGETLDLHGGGRDLLFPHHENELAQSEAATGKPFVRFWVHNGLLYTSGQKMSKSLGNFFLIEDLLRHYSADELRFFLLSTHFRSQAEYSQERLDEASAAFQRILQGMARLEETLASAGTDRAVSSEAGVGLREAAERLQREYFAALDSDFNTAGAFGKIFELVRLGNRFVDEAKPGRDRGALEATLEGLRAMLRLLGFTLVDRAASRAVPADVVHLAESRHEARRQRQWAEADVLRDRLLAMGWIVEDRPDGYRLQRRSGA